MVICQWTKVDLAGSERVHRTEACGEALAEGIHINSSLSSLIDVIQQVRCSPHARSLPLTQDLSILPDFLL
jgi:hypothetical protein